MIMSGGSSSSTAVNPPTSSLSSLASSTPPSSEFIYVNGTMTNTTPPMATSSYDTLQLSLLHLGQKVSLEEALMRVRELMKENSDLKAVLQQNNHAMHEQCQVLSSVKYQWAAERNEMKHKFEQTRDVILTLRRTVEVKEARLADLESQLSHRPTDAIMTKEESPSLAAQMHSLRQRREDAEKRAELHSAQNKFLQKQTDKLNDKLTELIEAKSNLESERVRLRETNEQLGAELGELKKLTVKQQEAQEQLVREKQELMRLNTELSSQVDLLKDELMCPAARAAAYTEPTEDDLYNQEFVVVPRKPESPTERRQLTPVSEESENYTSNNTDNHESNNSTATSSNDSNNLTAVKNELEEERKRIQGLQKTLKEQKDVVESLRNQISEKDKVILSTREQMDTTMERIKHDHQQQLEDLTSKMKLHTGYSEDVATLRAQVVSLVNELYDTEQRLREANEDIERYKHSCTELQNRVRMHDVEVSKQRSREDKLNEDLRTRLARLEVTLRQEQEDKKRKEVSLQELRINFDQLCNDYHELLASQDDSKAEQQAAAKSAGLTAQQRSKLEDNLDNLTAQICIAEEALTQKDEMIAELRVQLKKSNEEIIPILRAQVDVYKRDFEDERAAREKLNEEKERYKDETQELHKELDELRNKNVLLETQIRSFSVEESRKIIGIHGPVYDPEPPEDTASAAAFEDLEHICPICQEKCPDPDSLKIHLTDCLDRDDDERRERH